jgi:hypothetical protein
LKRRSGESFEMPEPRTLLSASPAKAVLEERFGRGFSHQYVSKIADKSHAEA